MVKTEEAQGLQVPQQARRLKAYAKNLAKDKEPNNFDKRVVAKLLELAKSGEWVKDELDYLDSVGYKQSKYEYSQIKEQIENFEKPNHPWFGWNKNYQQALNNLIQEARTLRLKALDYRRNFVIEEAIPRDDSHAGFEFIITGLRKKGEYRDGLLESYEAAEAKAKKIGTFSNDILIGTRTQAAPPYDENTGLRNHEFKPKTRLVSMVRFMLILAEMKFSHHYQRAIGISKWYAGGKDERQQRNIIKQMRANGHSYWISIDYSKYDQSISKWLIYDAFTVIRAAYEGDPNFDEELFNIVVKDFIHKRIVDGTQRFRPLCKGVPSGSMFTQAVDSVVNRLMIDTFMISKGITRYEMFIMGDDNLIYVTSDMSQDELLNTMESYLMHNFGIKMNATKSGKGEIQQSPFFLSRRWDLDGEWRAPGVLLAKLVQPERFRDYDRHGFEPIQVINSYVDTFPKGMFEFIDRQKYQIAVAEATRRVGPDQYLSGLMRFKARYENKRYSAV